MSTIFYDTTIPSPRKDATIRVKAFKPGGVEDAGYHTIELLEFYPDFDNRLKFRGRAYVRPCEALSRPEHAHIYEVRGAGFLDQPYIEIRENFIHPSDREEMMAWCREQVSRRGYTSLVIHKQPLPFPMFKKGTRITVLEYKDNYHDTITTGQAGQLATVAEDSSIGAMSSVIFDNPELNRGYKSVGVPSIALREVEE